MSEREGRERVTRSVRERRDSGSIKTYTLRERRGERGQRERREGRERRQRE